MNDKISSKGAVTEFKKVVITNHTSFDTYKTSLLSIIVSIIIKDLFLSKCKCLQEYIYLSSLNFYGSFIFNRVGLILENFDASVLIRMNSPGPSWTAKFSRTFI